MDLSSIENELFMAIDRGNALEVEKCLKAGADLTVVNNQRDNVLHAYFKSLLNARRPFDVRQSYYEANQGTPRELERLNQDWQRELNRRRQTFELLIEHIPSDLLNTQDKEGFTPLVRSVEMSLPYEAKKLYSYGSDLHFRTRDYHFGVLDMAVYQNNISLLDFFYQEMHQPSVSKNSSSARGTKEESFYRHRNLMMIACMKGNLEALKYLYQKEPEKLNEQDTHGDTAALICVRVDSYGLGKRSRGVLLEPIVSYGQLLCLNFLLDKGARVDIINLEGRTLVDCVRSQQLSCLGRVEELYQAQTGKKPQIDDAIEKKRLQLREKRLEAIKQNEEAARRRKAIMALVRQYERAED